MGKPLPVVDYVVMAVSLVGTATMGLYFSRSGKGSLDSYMLGNRRMTVLPIALSLSASILSANAVVEIGMESYMYGAQSMVIVYGLFIGCFICYFFYIPVLLSLKSVSPFEFFDRRFNSHVRKFVSVISMFDMFLYVVTSLYTPALTFSQVVNFNYFTIACGLAVVCFIYTVTGGLKAVAWAESIQIIIVTACSVWIFISGVIQAGGPAEVVKINEEGYRMEFFNMDPSLYQRMTFWTGLGVVSMWAPFFLSPAQHQRFQALPSEKHVKLALIVSSILMYVIVAFYYTLGLVVYAYFAGCDPKLAQKNIDSYSTIIPYFVSEIAASFPGLTGLFHSSMMAAGFSSVTSSWNTLGCVVLEDLVKPFLKSDVNEKTSYRIIFGIVFVISLLTVICVYWLPLFGSLIEISIIMRSFSQATMIVLFNTGMFLPWVNSKGIVAGGLTSAAMTMIVIIGSIKARSAGLIKDLTKIMSTEKCVDSLTNLTAGVAGYGSHTFIDPGVFWLFKISPYNYMIPGIAVGAAVAIVVSFLTGPQNLHTVDPNMIVRQMRWVLPPSNEGAKTAEEGKLLKREIPLRDVPKTECT